MKTPEELLNASYEWGDCGDIEEDIENALSGLDGEFTGTLKVVVTYEKDEE